MRQTQNQQSLPGVPPRKLIVDPQQIIAIIKITAEANYKLGIEIGYAHGRQDERHGKPWSPW